MMELGCVLRMNNTETMEDGSGKKPEQNEVSVSSILVLLHYCYDFFSMSKFSVACAMAQQVKVLTMQTLQSDFRTHLEEGKNQLHKVVPRSPYACSYTHTMLTYDSSTYNEKNLKLTIGSEQVSTVTHFCVKV